LTGSALFHTPKDPFAFVTFNFTSDTGLTISSFYGAQEFQFLNASFVLHLKVKCHAFNVLSISFTFNSSYSLFGIIIVHNCSMTYTHFGALNCMLRNFVSFIPTIKCTYLILDRKKQFFYRIYGVEWK